MADLEDLLVLQNHDTSADQLRHRRQTLPELAELARVSDELAAVERGALRVAADRDEVAARQRRHEVDLAAAEAKIADVERQLYSGATNSPRELQALQAEVDSLKRFKGTIEDKVLEAMTDSEPLDAEVERLAAERTRLDEAAARLRTAIAEAQTSIDADLAVVAEARQVAAKGLDPEMLDVYAELRAQFGGVGVARLVNGRCGGCHLTLPAVELDRLRREPPETLIRCDQCGRILVR